MNKFKEIYKDKKSAFTLCKFEKFFRPKACLTGFTLIEVLIDIAIVGLIAAAVFSAYSVGFKSMEFARAKIGAVALANEKMEELRNMPYDSLSTLHGPIFPQGTVSDDQQIVRKGITFDTHISIYYIDDPYDGCADSGGQMTDCLINMPPGKPVDLYPFDYKKAEITISKHGGGSYMARLTSNFSAKAAETSSNSGIILLCVIDSLSAPVPGSNIAITNTTTDPPVNIVATTGSDGCIMVPNLPPDDQGHYHLVATKNGYSTDMTYPKTPQNPNQLQPDQNVLVQQVTKQILQIDKLSTLIIDVKDDAGQVVPNASLHLEGTKLTIKNPPTPKYVADKTTDANGHLELPNMEFDSYNITVADWTVASTSPYQPVPLVADTTQNINIVVTHSSDVPIITMCDPANGISGTTVTTQITGTNFDNEISVKLVNSGTGAEIIGQNISVAGHASIDVTFDLSGASLGFWNIVLTNSGGSTITQVNGFEIKSS